MSKKKSHSNISFGRGTWSAIALAMLGLAVVAGFYFEQSTRISAVEFRGHEFTTEDELQEALISPVGLPYVRDVAVRMTYRGTLTVEVTERKPIGLLAVKPETFFDSVGVQLPAQPGIGVDVPLVYGFKPTSPGDTLKGKGFDQIKEFLNAASRDPFGWATLSEVAWNENEGVVALSSENGVKLLFGRNRFDQKVSHWKAFYQDVVAHRGINDFRTVDLRFRNQIVTDEL